MCRTVQYLTERRQAFIIIEECVYVLAGRSFASVSQFNARLRFLGTVIEV